jgi:tRNA dimethylallyltransferase
MLHGLNISHTAPILIAGPTASGKSARALEIAERFGGQIINADSMQVFAGWRVLTARPNLSDEARAPHKLYGHMPQDAPYSVGHWLRDIAPLLAGGERPIIVGGTGLYFTALTEGLADIPLTPQAVRAEADAFRLNGGLAQMIAALDPNTRARTDPRNPMRVQRAWEVQHTTGRGLADWQDSTPAPLLPLAECHALLLAADRDWLNARIARRMDAMIAEGALDEVRAQMQAGNMDCPSASAIGALELAAYLREEVPLQRATEAATIATRQFAKRQRTWFRARMKGWHSVSVPKSR